jgi:predicted nuclease with TOPRIM domain
MSCKLTYEELHKRYHDAADENKELRQILAKMAQMVTSEVPSGIFQNYLQEENDRLALSVETFRRHQEKDSDKKKNLHDYLVTVLGYNQEQIMEIMESGAMLSNDDGVGYKFEHDFGRKDDEIDTQVEMDFESNPRDEGVVSSETSRPNNMLTRHVYAHMGYAK